VGASHTVPDWIARRAVIGADTWCVLGRLRSGVSRETARAEMRAVAAGPDEQMPISSATGHSYNCAVRLCRR
jgi:hypothetical protein